MEHVNLSDISTDDQKVRFFNGLIDEINSLRLSNDVYNAEVDEYNKSTGFEKGDK